MAETKTIIPRIAALALMFTLVPGCDWMKKKEPPNEMGENQKKQARDAQLRRACASELTYDRLKEYAFDEAQRIRGRDHKLLDDIATYSLVRMEEPIVKSRDESLNVTVCTGRLVLELPPGAVNAFDGQRRLTAEVEYAAQSAVDGSGLVYDMTGAEPIIYRLATIGGVAVQRPVLTAEAPMVPPVLVPEPMDAAPRAAPEPSPPPRTQVPAPAPTPAPAPAAVPRPQPKAQAPVRAATRPSFNCRSARTRTERMVCENPGLAGQDRQMAARYYAEMANADGSVRAALRRSRDRFLSRRERCSSEACVAAAYQDRVREIEEISGR